MIFTGHEQEQIKFTEKEYKKRVLQYAYFHNLTRNDRAGMGKYHSQLLMTNVAHSC
jgi:hypothetical protein